MLIKIKDYESLVKYKDHQYINDSNGLYKNDPDTIYINIWLAKKTEVEICTILDIISTLNNITEIHLRGIPNDIFTELDFNFMAELPNIEQLVVNNLNNYCKSSFIWNNIQVIACENYIFNGDIHKECTTIKFLRIPDDFDSGYIDELSAKLNNLHSDVEILIITFKFGFYQDEIEMIANQITILKLINNLPIGLQLLKIVLDQKTMVLVEITNYNTLILQELEKIKRPFGCKSIVKFKNGQYEF